MQQPKDTPLIGRCRKRDFRTVTNQRDHLQVCEAVDQLCGVGADTEILRLVDESADTVHIIEPAKRTQLLYTAIDFSLPHCVPSITFLHIHLVIGWDGMGRKS